MLRNPKPSLLFSRLALEIPDPHIVGVESQNGERSREQARPESTKPGTEHDGTKKERYGSGHQIAFQQQRTD